MKWGGVEDNDWWNIEFSIVNLCIYLKKCIVSDIFENGRSVIDNGLK